MERWLPWYFFLFGLDTAAGNPTQAYPLVDIPPHKWDIGWVEYQSHGRQEPGVPASELPRWCSRPDALRSGSSWTEQAITTRVSMGDYVNSVIHSVVAKTARIFLSCEPSWQQPNE